MTARIVIISGASGAGKTSISRKLAENSTYDHAVHIHMDDFSQYIRKGYIAPWMNGTGDQNETIVEAAAASAERFSAGGYEVFADWVLGPWFLKPWIKLAENGVDIRYVVLRPDEQTTIARATERQKRNDLPLNIGVTKDVWRVFSDMGKYESNVVDTTTQTIDESVTLIQKMLLEGAFHIV